MAIRRPCASIGIRMLTARKRLTALFALLLVACTTPASHRLDASTCQPACRTGFTCVGGACVSPCNPMCPVGTFCTTDLQCIPTGSDAGNDVPSDGPIDTTMPPPCRSSEVLCGASCSDLQRDPLNCGRCGYACPVPANAEALCDGAVCSSQCLPLYTASGGMCALRATPGGTWRPTAGPTDPIADSTPIWTGTEMLVVILMFGASMPIVGAAYSPSTDTWRELPTAGAPTPRVRFSVAWTGSEVIVWGGWNLEAEGGALNDGYRYNPSSDTWTPMSISSATPSPRTDAMAAWAGDRLIVWGGVSGADLLDTGASYRPDTDTWTPLMPHALNAPSPRAYPTGVWTGRELLVWGGCVIPNPYPTNCYSDGSRFDPVTSHWTAMSTDGAPSSRARFASGWTGSYFVVWGGGVFNLSASTWSAESDGMRYDPSVDRWSPLPGSPLTGRHRVTGVWTGVEFVVWGGVDALGVDWGDGSRYDPVANVWNTLSTSMAPTARDGQAAVWTGTELLIAGGTATGGIIEYGAGGAWRP